MGGFAFDNFNYYPNPVKNNGFNKIEITAVLGQKMLSQKANGLQTEINLSSLSNGICFVKISAKRQEKIGKIIKE